MNRLSICISCFRQPAPEEDEQNHKDNRFDENFSIARYIRESRVRYKLKKRKTKNAEELLQQMFEDELNEDDLGPDTQDFDDLNDVINEEDENKLPRKVTLDNVDSQI